MKYQNILFDLDGTLTDPVEGITKSVQYALKKVGVTVEDHLTLTPFIGPPLSDSFQEFYHLSPEQTALAVDYYRDYFEPHGIFQNVPYPGVADFLASLNKAGKRLYVASSKPEDFVRRILEHFALDSYFLYAGGASMDGVRSRKADVVQYVLTENNITDLDHTIMIGDRKHDVEGAKECGLPCIGVLFGYGSAEELTTAGAIAVVKDFDELLQMLLP